MTFDEILVQLNALPTQKVKGDRFEEITLRWLHDAPTYKGTLEKIWLWKDFPSKGDFGDKDLGIDLVARTTAGGYWAIQCKCYAEGTTLSKQAIDSFISDSGRMFTDPVTQEKNIKFSARVLVTTLVKLNENAQEMLRGREIPTTIISYSTFVQSDVDWEAIFNGTVPKQKSAKQPREHQVAALKAAHDHFATHERGKLIMACGTGKTYTSLAFIEQETKGQGTILFLVPSIALLSQTLKAWLTDTQYTIHPICICSDSDASKIKKDDTNGSLRDLPLPATTNANTITSSFKALKKLGGLLVVFSTYQSIEKVHEAQEAIVKSLGEESAIFDYIICDEAHRTTGAKATSKEEAAFVKVHDGAYLLAKHRLYMTATPRVYGEGAKSKASEASCTLYSMDDEEKYGKEFYRVGFGYAVEHGLLTDYKVLVLTVPELVDLPKSILTRIEDAEDSLSCSYASRLYGCVMALSKLMCEKDDSVWCMDPCLMKRALVFCPNIEKKGDELSSKNTVERLKELSAAVIDGFQSESAKQEVVKIEAQHIDGSMSTDERTEKLEWLKKDSDCPNECRILCNVRCLSEGVDVPALDAVIFLAPRSSQVDIVQSVGRVMRNFKQNKEGGKKYGYIIIPLVVPPHIRAWQILDKDEQFRAVWNVLRALRSHDESFNAMINQINLTDTRPEKLVVGPPLPSVIIDQRKEQNRQELKKRFTEQLSLFQSNQDLTNEIYAKMVEKVGDRLYWERWAGDVGGVAQNLIGCITEMVGKPGEHQDAFQNFICGLRNDINDSITKEQAIEMLAQHFVCKPVFDALFKDFSFSKNNPVAKAMEGMLDRLTAAGMQKDTAVLDSFYKSVELNLGKIDNLEGKQRIIKDLYERFFKLAFPKAVEQLGIVYTPVECVDFIIHSVDDVLKKEFGCGLTDKNVHISDLFTGTGTFITRLFQTGVINPDDMERKYLEELHCNEIVLLAYYVASVNIESVFHAVTNRKKYLHFDGICLTDSFELAERDASGQGVLYESFKDNSAAIERQRKTNIKVFIGNPPYSAGQKSANDDAQNLKYPKLDERIEQTYVAQSTMTNKNSLYDSYIRAFRLASDRLRKNPDGGVIGFITNGGWVDGNAAAGMRKCLEEEFSSVYVYHLRGDARTQGELRRKEGDNAFESGSRAPVVITILVQKPKQHGEKGKIYFHDIGDYLSREDKLGILSEQRSVLAEGLEWKTLTPDQHGDWVSQRSDLFESFLLIADKKEKAVRKVFFMPIYSGGVKTNRDAWCYNYSRKNLIDNITRSIEFYNKQCGVVANGGNFVYDSKQFSWNRQQQADVAKNKLYQFKEISIYLSEYRPFCKEHIYFNRSMNDCVYQMPQLFPEQNSTNLLICVSGLGGTKDHSVFCSNVVPDFNMLNAGTQCFPRYYYEEDKSSSLMSLLPKDDPNRPRHVRKDAITDWILNELTDRFNSNNITKDDIFYYVYGVLHSPQYRTRFANDLKKSLPRIPIVEKLVDFREFSKQGKALAELHLNYETIPPCSGVIVTGDESKKFIVEKMRFADKTKKDTIVYNGSITVSNIPPLAHEYIVNGRSGIEWVMECYRVKTDKDSGITNNPNDWAKEQKKPRYILDLLLSVINVSVQTMEIVKALPELVFDEEDVKTPPREHIRKAHVHHYWVKDAHGKVLEARDVADTIVGKK